MLEAEDLLVVPVGRLLQATRRSVNSGGERIAQNTPVQNSIRSRVAHVFRCRDAQAAVQ